MMNRYLYFLLLPLLAACGAQKYTANNFEELTKEHETVAILPVEMIFTGKQPKDLSKEDIHKIEEAESEAFQISLSNALFDKANRKRIYFQEVDKTNTLLGEKGYSIRESWNMEGDKLSELLGVDAVVKMRVEKQRYMSDLASYGIDIAQHIVRTLSNHPFWLPGRLDKTNDIHSKATLVNQSDGKVLWNMAVDREADWSRPSREIIESITRKYARNFPYDE